MQNIEIRVKGHLDKDWGSRLGPVTISHTAEGDTVLTGSVRDQASLNGLLNTLYGLGLQLISVSCEHKPP